jgi:serine/threonine-protein kinase RsbW
MTQPSSTPGGEHRAFAARLDALPDAVAFVAGFCARRGIARADALRLSLIVEELFTNTVRHGYRGEGDSPIHLTLGAVASEVTILYEDAAPAYDPLASPAPVEAAAGPVESRPVGGLGLRLVREMAHEARYAHDAGHNRLWLRVRCPATGHHSGRKP